MRYEAKIDWWLGASMLFGLALPILLATESSPWWLLASGVAALLIFGCWYPQSYETTAGGLLIRAGMTRRRIPYAQITDVRPVSEAQPLHRVLIEYGGKAVLVVPANQDAFFADLAARVRKKGTGAI